MVSNDPNGGASPSRAGTLGLIGGAVALDFANTASGRGGPFALEHLQEPRHLAVWAEHAGVIDAATAARFEAAVASGGMDGGALLSRAIALREAIHRAAVAVAEGGRPQGEDLATIKTACAQAIAAADLAPGSERYAWVWPTDPPVPETILGPIALSAVGLFREADPARIKQCGGEHCGWVFFDMTKNKSRRWCEMSVCGNRAKQKRHARKAERVG